MRQHLLSLIAKREQISMTIYHKHHIIPKHAGGTDDPSNLILLTVEEHAEAHRLLYEEHGRLQDYYAWKGLSGQISMDFEKKFEIYQAIVAQKTRERVKNGTHHLLKRADGTSVVSDRVSSGNYHMLGGEIQGKTSRRRVADGTHNWIGDGTYQRTVQQDRVKNETHHFQHKVKKECSHCAGLFDEGNYKRYHGENCSVKTGIKRSEEKVQCPYCDKIGGKKIMIRWHFDRCKLKSEID